MKGLSGVILVLLSAVTVVPFSESTNTGSTSPEHILRNPHKWNRPVFQRMNKPEINSQIVDKMKSQPLLNQYNIRRRPGTSYPRYQAVPGVPNTAPRFNSQINNRNANFSPQDTLLNHVISDPDLKAIYAATKPTKRYTVIHPNGTVEHTDELHLIVARHPNYVIVKADDILRKNNHQPIAPTRTTPVHNNRQPIQHFPLASTEPLSNANFNYQRILNSKAGKPIAGISQVSYQRPAEKFQSPTVLRKHQFQINPTNINQGINKHQATYKTSYEATAPLVQKTVPRNTIFPVPVPNPPLQVQNPILPVNRLIKQNLQNHYQDIINKNYVPKNVHENAVPSNPAAIYNPIKYQENLKISTNNAQTVSNNPFSKKDSNEKDNKAHANAVAINPLPIYPSRALPQITTISDKVYESPAAVDAKDIPPKLEDKNQEIIINPLVLSGVNEAVLAYNSSLSSNENNEGKQTFSVTLPHSVEPTSTLQIPAKRLQHETLPVLLPEVATQNTSQNVLMPSTLEGSTAENTPGVTKISEATISNAKNETTSPDPPSNLEPSSDKIIGLSSTRHAPNGTNIQFDTTITSANKTNINSTGEELNIQSKIQIATIDATNQNVTNKSTPAPSTEKLWDWFEFDENTMEDIMYNSENVYFFFVPSQPKVVKDTKTTIYPNGTTVQEIIETQVICGEDGEPEVKQTKTVTRT